MLALLAAAALATAQPPGVAQERAAIAACLRTDRFSITVAPIQAARAAMSEEAWQSDCRAARDANERRLSVVRAMFATGRSPVGGYRSTLELLDLARAASDPLLVELFQRTARDQAARESLSCKCLGPV